MVISVPRILTLMVTPMSSSTVRIKNAVRYELRGSSGKHCVFGHLGLVFIWSCLVFCLLFLLFYVISATVPAEAARLTPTHLTPGRIRQPVIRKTLDETSFEVSFFYQCGPSSIPKLGVICGLSLLVLYTAKGSSFTKKHLIGLL